MPNALSKTIVITDNKMTISEYKNEAWICDRDGVRLGRLSPDRIGATRNWLSDFLNRTRVNERRDNGVQPHEFVKVEGSPQCAMCKFRKHHRAHRV
jgi:hypothetical protein